MYKWSFDLSVDKYYHRFNYINLDAELHVFIPKSIPIHTVFEFTYLPVNSLR